MEYLDGVADGVGASADLADRMRSDFAAPEARAALAALVAALRGTSAVWRDMAIQADTRELS
jgi:hypothetical protein